VVYEHSTKAISLEGVMFATVGKGTKESLLNTNKLQV